MFLGPQQNIRRSLHVRDHAPEGGDIHVVKCQGRALRDIPIRIRTVFRVRLQNENSGSRLCQVYIQGAEVPVSFSVSRPLLEGSLGNEGRRTGRLHVS